MKKTLILAICFSLQPLLQAQSAAQGVAGNMNTNAAMVEYGVVARTANSRVWDKDVIITNAAGTQTAQRKSYTGAPTG